MSCVLFNSVVEYIMRGFKASWSSKGMGFDLGEGRPRRLQNLRFADDIMLFAPSLLQAARMLSDLAGAFAEVGLSVHFGKTKFMSNVAGAWVFGGSCKKRRSRGAT